MSTPIRYRRQADTGGQVDGTVWVECKERKGKRAAGSYHRTVRSACDWRRSCWKGFFAVKNYFFTICDSIESARSMAVVMASFILNSITFRVFRDDAVATIFS